MIIIEDGTIVPNANSLVTLDEFNNYLITFNITTALTDVEKEALLIQAMQYLLKFEIRLTGYRKSNNQYLMFPRKYCTVFNELISDSEIHYTWKSAQLEAAKIGLSNDFEDSGRLIKAEKSSVGALSEEFEYEGRKRSAFKPIVAILQPTFKSQNFVRTF